MRPFFILLFFTFSCASPCLAKSKASSASEAGHFYEEKKFEEALAQYIGLNQEFPHDANIQYNLANTYYQMGKYPEAASGFLSVALKAEEPSLKQNSFFNLGNSYYRQGKLEEAITAYQQALELKPDDLTAKQNLEFVREEMKKRMNQEKERQEKEQEQKEKKEKEGQGDGEEQQKPESPKQEEGEENQKDSAQNEGQQQDKNEKEQQGKPEEKKGEEMKGAQDRPEQESGDKTPSALAEGDEKEISQEEAERYLNTLKEDGSLFLKKQIKTQPGKRGRTEKDW